MKLDELMVKRHELKVEYEAKRKELQEKQEEFNRVNGDLMDDVQDLTYSIEMVEKEIRRVRVEMFDGDKREINGVGVKEFTVLDYKEEEALEYAKERLPDAVVERLDKKVFEAVAKTGALEFVIIRKEPRAYISGRV